MSDVELILSAVEASGLSARRFAERVLARDERVVRRWTAGQLGLPSTVRDWLARFVALDKRDRQRLVRLLTA